MPIRRHLFACLALMILLASCAPHDGSFDPMSGYEGDTIVMSMDLDDAVLQGIMLPAKGEYFHFLFDTTPGLHYKIYYQNESYKFDDADSLSYENFYGSWEEASIGFKAVPADGHIRDSFRIVGNPRDERIYYGIDLAGYDCGPEAIRRIDREIRNCPEWFDKICHESAPQNHRTVEEQMFLDIRWVLNERRHEHGDANHRWKRNPRTGCYSFLLVVCDNRGLASIPDPVVHIGSLDADSHFVNPYGWYAAHRSRHIALLRGSKVLRTYAELTPRGGVYLDELSMRQAYSAKVEIPGAVGSDTVLARHALYQQFFPAVSQQYTLRNIPLVCDIDRYSRADYDAAALRYPADTRLNDYPHVTDSPGATVRLSDARDYITLVNPGNAGRRHPVKESTGIKSRIGFSYGRYRGKIKFPPLLNAENVWNGLTCAFWLIYQDEHPWNNRRPSYHGGYLDKNDESPEPDYHLRDKYSEIDIEIVKASQFWPAGYYPRRDRKSHSEDASRNSDVAFCCTNWDLACPEPSRFASGITPIRHNGRRYDAMRWYDTYKALTTKTPVPNSIFDADYYYYEIEWSPRSIIWRLGPDPQHLRVVGYMDDRYTAIPNNQMLCVVTQEYHYSEWWPPIVFEQGLIPYNASDIEGRVYSITIE